MIGGPFTRTAALVASVGCAFLLCQAVPGQGAYAAEVKVMSTVALTPTLDELKAKYESSGNRLVIVYNTIAGLRKQIDAGETADVLILSRPVLEALQSQGKVADGSIANMGKTYVAIGVRTGAPLPDISTAEKLKAALLAAKSISYADPAKGGASGVYFARVIDRLGITDQMKSKTVLVPGGGSSG
jgi:molybdate transport system substrate-binding protein